MSRKDPQFNLRIPEAMRDAIRQAAKANRRSDTAEILDRLEHSFAVPSPTEGAQPMGSTKFSRHIDDEGRVSFKIGDHALDPTNRKEQIVAAHLLKKYDHPDNSDIAGEQWINWLGVRRSQESFRRLMVAAWCAFTSQHDIADVAKRIGPILEEVFGHQPAPVERHPVQLVVKVSHDKSHPKPITLFVEDSREQPVSIRELDPNNDSDVTKAIYCLKSEGICPPFYADIDKAFRLLTNWYGQAEQQVTDEALKTWWDSVLPAGQLSPEQQPNQSARSRIGHVLDRFTETAGDLVGYSFDLRCAQLSEETINDQTLVLRDLPALQQELADLFASILTQHAGQQQVLKARGATVLDCHQLGLLSDDDMANHLADCLMVMLDKPVGAKAAKSIMLSAIDYAHGADFTADREVPQGESRQAADALEACDWSGMPIGNKAIIAQAVRLLRGSN